MRRQKIKVPNTHRLGSGKVHKSAVPMAKDYCFLGLDGEDERVMNVFRGVFGWVKIDKIQEKYKDVNGTIIRIGKLKSTLTKLVAENKLTRTKNRGQYVYGRTLINGRGNLPSLLL